MSCRTDGVPHCVALASTDVAHTLPFISIPQASPSGSGNGFATPGTPMRTNKHPKDELKKPKERDDVRIVGGDGANRQGAAVTYDGWCEVDNGCRLLRWVMGAFVALRAW